MRDAPQEALVRCGSPWNDRAMRAAALSIALVACAATQPAPLSNHAMEPPRQTEPQAQAQAQAETPRDPSSGVAATLAQLERFSDEMCGCRDRDCADRVIDDMMRWSHDLTSAGEGSPLVNGVQGARAKAAADRVSRCMAVVYARRASANATP
jgi:hypothetical protein